MSIVQETFGECLVAQVIGPSNVGLSRTLTACGCLPDNPYVMSVSRRFAIGMCLLGTLLLCVLFPMAGAVFRGDSPAKYSEFPPVTRYVVHEPFSWAFFWGLGMLELVCFVLPGIWILVRTAPAAEQAPALSRRLPWWGWVGLVWSVLAWILAWSRFPWFARWQRHTFTPLWVGYIVVVNAWCYRRTGRSMLTHRPLYFAMLFPVSAVFWWLFEYLNRFVQNWYYVGFEDVTASEYFWFATLPFSTVLPAVLGTYELLGAYLGETPLMLPKQAGASRRMGMTAAAFAVACAGLLGIGRYPNYLFPLLWIAPLIVLAAFMEWIGEDSIVFNSPWPRGLRRLVLLAAAALVCGFFWEMWNYRSLAKWIYAVPFVNRFRLFEMPILGYAGYLPFGWECGLVGIAVARILSRDKVNTHSA